MNYSTGTLIDEETRFIIFAVIIFFFIATPFFIYSYLRFKEERDYIKMEIECASEEEEYLYWKSELKMLYISKIPIVRSIVRRKYNR